MSKIRQKGGFLFSSSGISDLPMATIKFFSITKFNSKRISKNTGAKKNHKIIVDAGLNALAKKIKKGISSMIGSGITLANNERKDIIKVIKSFENRGILLKELVKKLIVKKEDS